MTTSKELRAWAYTLKGWASSVDNIKVREHIVQLAAELEHLPNAKKLLKGSLCNVCGNRPSATRCWDIFCWCCSASR